MRISLRWHSGQRVGAVTFAFAGLLFTSRVVNAQTAARAAAAAPQVSAAPAPGVDTALDARVKAVASRLRCPVCQGEAIQDSPAELAGQMKLLVREQLASGRSEQEVLDYFTAKYGQWILLEPKAEGINLLVYGLPIVFLIVGGAGIVMAVKKWSRPHAPQVAADSSPTLDREETAP